MLEYITILIPSLLGYGTAMFCKINKNSGSNVSITPPPIVFSIVWSVLYIMLGFSWYFSRQNEKELSDLFYGFLIIFLSLWIIIYSCKQNKKLAVYVLLLSFTFSLLSYTVGNLESKLLIVPLIGWLLFATLLNILEVQLLSSPTYINK